MAPSLIKLKQSEADRNTLGDFARNLNRNIKTKQSMDIFLLLVVAKSSQWQHRLQNVFVESRKITLMDFHALGKLTMITKTHNFTKH